MTSIFAPFFNSSADGTLIIWPLTTGVELADGGTGGGEPGCALVVDAEGFAGAGAGVGAAMEMSSISKIRTELAGILGGMPRVP